MPTFDDWLKEQDNSNQTATNLSLAVEANPQAAAEAVKQARRNAIPPSMVGTQPDPDYTRRNKLEDAASTVRQSPTLEQWLNSQPPVVSAAVGDDLNNLSALDKALEVAKGSGKALYSSLYGFNEGFYGLVEAGGSVLPDFMGDGVEQFGRNARLQAKSFKEQLAPQGSGPLSAGWYSGLQSAGQMILTLPAAVMTGNPILAAQMMSGSAAFTTAGQSFGQARDEGLGVAPSLTFASGQGLIEYLTEQLPALKLFGDLNKGTGLGRIIRNQLATEIPGEQLATVLQDFNEWATLNPEKPFSEFVAERPEAALTTAVATIVGGGAISAAAAGLDAVVNRARGQDSKAQQARQLGDTLRTLQQLAEATATRERDVDTLESFLQTATDGTAVEALYIDGNKLIESGLAQQLAAASPAVASQLEQAQAGTMVRIPTSEVLGRFNQELAPLLPEMRTDPNGFTQREADEFLRERGPELQAEVERVLGSTDMAATDSEARQRVRDTVASELMATGRVTRDVADAYASLTGAFYHAMGKRMGMDAETLFNQERLRVFGEGEGAFDQRSIRRIVSTYGTEVSSLLDAEKALSNGDRVFIMHEMDDAVFEAKTPEILNQYTPDQMVIVPAGSFKQKPYETDLFGNEIPLPPSRKARAAAQAVAGGDVSAITPVFNNEAQGTYFVRTEPVETGRRELGIDLVRTPSEAAQAFAMLGKNTKESFNALLTDASGKPLALVGVTQGTIDAASVYNLQIVTEAFRIEGATKMWLGHNHPSGNSMLSKADESVAVRLGQLFSGSSIEVMGILAIAGGTTVGGRNWSYADAVTLDPEMGNTVEPQKTVSVPIIERQFTAHANSTKLSDPASAIRAAKNQFAGQTGVMLLNNSSNLVGFLPMTAQQMGKLRDNGNMDTVFRALSMSNASQVVIVSGSSEVTTDQAENLANLLGKIDVRVLDVVDIPNYDSWAQRGAAPQGYGSFFQGNVPRLATWFSGARTVEAAINNVISVMAVEYDAKINNFANAAYGTEFSTRGVEEVDPQELKDANVTLFHASPVCKNFSAAKTLRGATELDRKSAESIARAITEARPPMVTIENVPEYQNTALFKLITDALDKAGYTWEVIVHNAADYGGAQNRERMLLRAVREGKLPPKPAKSKPMDWMDAIGDLLADAPTDTIPAEERRRLDDMIAKGKLDPNRPIITMGGSGFAGTWAAANDGGPAPTLKSAHEKPRVIMPDGTVRVVTARMMARLMGLPDSFKVPDSRNFAKLVLGNGIHGNVTRALIAPMLEQHAAATSNIDERTGLPLNSDGTVTVYHHTSAASAAKIQASGQIKSAGEPHVYFTSRPETDTGYGDTAVAVRVRPQILQIDDEFPNGRRDFSVSVGRPGGTMRIQAGQFNQSVSLRRGTQTLRKYGLNPNGKYKTREVAAALEARQREKYGTIDESDRSPEAMRKIAGWMTEEVMFAMEDPEKSGVGWYSVKFQRAIDTFAKEFPELKTDKTARDIFTILVAVTSDGQKVLPNFAQAADIYSRFRTGGATEGKFTTTRGHARQASIDNNLQRIQEMYDQLGPEAMHEFLMQERTVRELKQIAKAQGKELNTAYQVDVVLPMAAVVLGPKLGAFYANLMGAHGYLTMDRWWSRTFNRYRGTLLQAPTRQGLNRFKELYAADKQLNRAPSDISDDEVLSFIVEYRNSYEAKGYKNGTEIEKAANTIYKMAFENLEDTPFNAGDRTFMLDAVAQVAKNLKRRGVNMSVADIQAVLWYYEKRLYGELGARQTADISYEEAASRVIEARAAGTDFANGPNISGSDGNTAVDMDESVPPGEEDYQPDENSGEFNQPVSLPASRFAVDARDESVPQVWYRGQIGALANRGPFDATANGRAPSFADSPEVASQYASDPEAAGLYGFGERPDGYDLQGNVAPYRISGPLFDVRSLQGGHGTKTGLTPDAVQKILKDLGIERDVYLDDLYAGKYGKGKSAFYDVAEQDLPDSRKVLAAYLLFDNPMVQQVLQEKGYAGAVFNGAMSDSGSRDSSVPWNESVVHAELRAVQRGTLQSTLSGTIEQNQEGETRGSFSPSEMAIRLHKAQNLSTFLHESGHFYLHMLVNLAVRQDAPADIRADAETALRWMGVEEQPEMSLFDTWLSMSIDEQREYHERFARGFEVYLQEGKAPSVELEGVFSRFRAWLISVYKSLMQAYRSINPTTSFGTAMQAPLSDEVRAVFDRMLATDDEIRAAQAARSMGMMFTNAEEAAKFGVDWEAYHEQGQAATDAAVADLDAQRIRNMKWLANARSRLLKKLQRDFKDLRMTVHNEARAEAMAIPAYQAWEFLTTPLKASDRARWEKIAKSANVQPDTDSLLTAIAKLGGLQIDEVESQWGFDPADLRGATDNTGLGAGKPVARRKDGKSLEEMAELLADLGYIAVDENGKHDLTDFHDKLEEGLMGRDHYSTSADWTLKMYGPQAEAMTLDFETGATGAWGGRFDYDALIQVMGAESEFKRLIDLGMVRKAGGDHPDAVAEAFGFTSGQQLVQDLMSSRPPRDYIEGLTDAKMMERYSELATPEAREDSVNRALATQAAAKVQATELAALEKALNAKGKGKNGRTQNTLPAAAKSFAEQVIARLVIREIRPSQFTGSASRAGRAATKASKAGNLQEAALEKRNQLVNTYAARAASDALDEVERGAAYLKRFDNEGTRKNLDQDYLDQIDAILERYELRRVSNKGLDKRKALSAWIEEQEAMGITPDLPDHVSDAAKRANYRELSVEEFRGLVESIKQIEHFARLKKKLLLAKDKREFQALVTDLRASIALHAGNRSADNTSRADVGSLFMRGLKMFTAAHRKVASLAYQADGFQDGGPLWETLVRTANEQSNWEATKQAEMTETLARLLKALPRAERAFSKGKYFRGVRMSLTQEMRLTVALNWGNEGNRQRLMSGRNWTMSAVQEVLDTLTQEEWQFVQGVWDAFESLRPAIAEKERRVMGKEPNWVQATPVTTPFGQLRGGYFPIVYDPGENLTAQQNEEAEAAKRQLQGARSAATTRRNFVKARAAEVTGRPVLLTMDGMFRGLTDVIHDLAFHEWLIDANRVMRAIDSDLRDTYGAPFVQQFRSAVEAIAAGEATKPYPLDPFVRHVRIGSMVAGLGFNIVNAVLQPLGFTQSIVRIGAKWVAIGAARFATNPAAAARDVLAKSEFMRNRKRTQNRELNDLRNRIRGKSEARQKFDALLFLPMTAVQMTVDFPTWQGAYEKAQAEGHDEDTSVQIADQAVIASQGGGQIKDLAAIQRGPEMAKLFTVFYGYFSTAYNLGAERYQATSFRSPTQVFKLTTDLLLLYSVPAVLGLLIKEAFAGGDDDEEELAAKLKREQISYLFGLMVGVREFTGAAQLLAGGDMKGAASYGGPAGLRFIQEVYKFSQQVNQGDVDQALVRSGVNVAGIATHLPAAQINRTIDGVVAISEGRTDGPVDSARALVGGAPR